MSSGPGTGAPWAWAVAADDVHELVDAEQPDICLLVGPDLTVRWVNHSGLEATGLTAPELDGRDALELVHPEDLDVVADMIGRFADGAEMYRPIVRLAPWMAEPVSVEVVARRIPREEGTFLLIMARRQPSVTDLELMDELGVGVVLAGSDGFVSRCTARAAEFLGLDRSLDAFGPADRLSRLLLRPTAGGLLHADCPLAVALREDRPVHDRLAATAAGGTVRMLDVDARPFRLRSSDAIAGVMMLRDVTDRHRSELELLRRATRDDLTGLLNRSTFMARVDDLLDGCRADDSVGLLFVDLDRFKSINERFGHGAADRLLVRIGEALGADRLSGRLGGDEFAVALVVDGPEALEDAAAAIRAAVRGAGLDELHVAVTASVGVSSGGPETDAAALIEEADEALRQAKRSGRDRSRTFDRDMRVHRRQQNSMAELLRRHLERGSVEIAVQPVVDARTGVLRGGECLARIRDEHGVLVPAARWMDAAVRTGLIGDVDAAVLERTAALIAEVGALTDRLGLGMNLSDTSIARPDLSSWLLGTLCRAGAVPEQFVVEVPETVFPVIRDRSAHELIELKRAGAFIAVDDFGVGYASLAEVRDLPIDTVKVDRSFVTSAPDTPEAAILRASVEMSRALGCRIVAEGVETEEQARLLRRLGVDMLQGYLTGPPMEPGAFVALAAAEAAAVQTSEIR